MRVRSTKKPRRALTSFVDGALYVPHQDLDARQVQYISKLIEYGAALASPALIKSMVEYLERIRVNPLDNCSNVLFADWVEEVHVAFGDDALDLFKNPWKLFAVKGMGFATMTKVARAALGGAFDAQCASRINAAFVHAARHGEHTALLRNSFVSDVRRTLREGIDSGMRIDAVHVEAIFEEMIASGSFVELASGFYQSGNMYASERGIAHIVCTFAPVRYEDNPVGDEVSDHRLDDSQRAAVRGALACKLSIVTGGPGTGKTTTVKSIICASGICKENVVLLAPTHLAKMRLMESTGIDVRTLHTFCYSKDALSRGSLVVLDECSMVDTRMLALFLHRCVPARHVLLVGDKDQLPPIGAGMPFRELVEDGWVPAFVLTCVHRQNGDSPILELAARVRAGDVSVEGLGSMVTMCESDEDVREAMLRAFEPHKTQVLALNRAKSKLLGVEQLNAHCARVQHRLAELDPIWPPKYRVSDPVVVTKNSSRFFNGQRGIIERVGRWDPQARVARLKVRWESERGVGEDVEAGAETEDGSVEDDPKMIGEGMCALAHVLTVHKAQGSEYAHVLLLLGDEQTVMLQRELVYTAVTRAKSKLQVFTKPSAWARAVSTPAPRRRTLLGYHIREEAANASSV